MCLIVSKVFSEIVFTFPGGKMTNGNIAENGLESSQRTNRSLIAYQRLEPRNNNNLMIMR